MRDLQDGIICMPQDAGHRSHDPVLSDIRALLQHVHASIGVVENAMHSTTGADVDTSDKFFVLDDLTPRYQKLRCLLDEVDASLRAALHD